MKHKSVLLEEAISYLNIKLDGIYVDCTLGRAGHSSEILKRLTSGKLIAIDQDAEAIEESKKVLEAISSNFEIIKTNFKNLKLVLQERKIEKVNGILFDLGVSSPQLDTEKRGFSYHTDARLDMRMDKSQSLSAYEIINNYSSEELKDILYKYGEEKYAPQIVREIEKRKKTKKIKTTLELVEIIKKAVPKKEQIKSHPARKTFQALRIAVNDELNVLRLALKDAIEVLESRGRLVVITFHSLEDRICKEIFKEYSEIPEVVKGLPEIPQEFMPKIKVINKKPITPTPEEIKINNRARSAKMRVIEKI